MIIDPVGGENLQESLRCLAYRGRCVTVGGARPQHGTPFAGVVWIVFAQFADGGGYW